MTSSNYRAGRRREWACMHTLEAAGYECLRTAGSHGRFDVVAIGVGGHVRLIQVKTGSARISPIEREGLELSAREWTKRVTVEVWHYTKGKSGAVIEVIR